MTAKENFMSRLTIIGGGPGGYTAAFAAARAGWSVTLVERQQLGGTCLNRGCIPTKTIKASAEALELAHRLAEFGITGQSDLAVDMAAVLARKDRVRGILQEGLRKGCAKHGVTLHEGSARVLDAQRVEVTVEGAAPILVEGDAVLLATGSRVLELPGLAFDGKTILSSDDILQCPRIPQRLVVVGGGVMGCELAFIYRAFGSTVTLVEGQGRLLPIPGVDADVSTLLQREMKKARISCELNRTLTDVQVDGDVVRATLAPSPFLKDPTPAQQKTAPIEADMVLVTVGRCAETRDLGLEEAGVAVDARGWVTVNEHLQTSVPGIYAIGDVLGPKHIMLAHVAAVEGLHVVEHLLGKAKKGMDYSVVPSGIFTSPEVGSVGLSEAQAREAGHDVRTSTFQMRELGKAQATGELPGFFKIVADASGLVLGVHIVGAHATDMVAEAGLCLQMKGTVRDIAETIHAHPTLAEGLYEAAYTLLESEK